MKNEWLKKYAETAENPDFNSNVLTGFNANIDCSTSFTKLNIDISEVEPILKQDIRSKEDLKSTLKYCRQKGENHEVNLKHFNPNFSGKDQLGGQGGIIANYLSKIGNRSIFYTPFLSKEIASKMDKEVVYPVIDETLTLTSISEGVNSDRTKKNYIVKFEEESCRLILSDKIRGFGPYFRKSVEEKLTEAESSIDRILLSGFQNTEGNIEAKLNKAKKQLKKLTVPKHLEFVSKSEKKDKLILDKIAGEFTSIGMDGQEMKKIAKILGKDVDEKISLGEVYETAKKIISELGVTRVHIHTMNFQAVIAKKDYPIGKDQIRQGMLFGGLSAVSMAEKGRIPERDEIEFKAETMHISKLDDLEHFEDFFELENFTETGTADVENYKVVAVPTVIHEQPEKLAGMGDLISSGTFIGEIN